MNWTMTGIIERFDYLNYCILWVSNAEPKLALQLPCSYHVKLCFLWQNFCKILAEMLQHVCCTTSCITNWLDGGECQSEPFKFQIPACNLFSSGDQAGNLSWLSNRI